MRHRLVSVLQAVCQQRHGSAPPALLAGADATTVDPTPVLAQPSVPVVLVGLVWKWDDTPVRWRTWQ